MPSDHLEPVLETTPNASFCRRNWFYFHVVCYIVILLFSFATLFRFPLLSLQSGTKCPLYAVPQDLGEQVLADDNTEKMQWGSDANCNYCFFTSAFSFVISFVWCWFFCFCNTGSRLESGSVEISVLSANQKWRIIPPATICAMVMSIMTLVSSSMMSSGMNTLCNGLKIFRNESCHNDSSNIKWAGFYVNAAWAISECWVTSSFWLLLTLMLLLQCWEGPGERYTKVIRNTKK